MPDGSEWETRRADLRAAVNADQAEFLAVRYRSCNLEAGIGDERIADAMDPFHVVDPAGVEEWADHDAKFDTAVSGIASEIMRRARVLGGNYPFRLQGNRILYAPSHTLVYEFCLAVSQAPSLSKQPFNRLPPAFERLARDVVKAYLGYDAEAYRTGWPCDDLEERPTRFRGVIEKLNELTGEWCWNPAPGRPNDPDHTQIKDAGLDFVAWKRMPDRRAGQLFLVGQCACGDDWVDKFSDINLDALCEHWIRPLSAAPTLRVFTTPHHIPNDTYFAEVNTRAGLTLDRARIAMIAEDERNRDTILQAMKDRYQDLIRLVIPDFEVDPPAA